MRVEVGPRPTLPQLKELGEANAGPFLVWKTMIDTLMRDYPERQVKSAIMQSILYLPGASSVAAQRTVADMVRDVSKDFGIASTFDDSMQHLYALRQGENEEVSAYAARISDRVRLVHSFFPEDLPEAEVDKARTLRLFGGLLPSLGQAMQYAQHQLDQYTYPQLLERVKAAERSMLRAKGIEPGALPPRKDHAKDKHSRREKYPPRIRAQHVTKSSPEPTQDSAVSDASSVWSAPSATSSESESEEVPPAVRIRVTRMVDTYEGRKRKCFHCGSEDHLVRDCPTGQVFSARYLNPKAIPKTQGARNPKTTREKSNGST